MSNNRTFLVVAIPSWQEHMEVYAVFNSYEKAENYIQELYLRPYGIKKEGYCIETWITNSGTPLESQKIEKR